jgi:hypothetical protein
MPRFLLVTAAVAALLLPPRSCTAFDRQPGAASPSDSSAAEVPPVVRLVQTVQQCGQYSCRLIKTCGSGAVVGRLKLSGRLVVLTCAHGWTDATRISVEFPDVGTYAGEFICIDRQADLGLISINKAIGMRFLCLPIADDPARAGDRVEAYGFPGGGRLRVRRTEIKRYEGGNMIVDASLYGESGGPIVQNGRVVGVIWGTSNRDGYCVQLQTIRSFVASCMQSGDSITWGATVPATDDAPPPPLVESRPRPPARPPAGADRGMEPIRPPIVTKAEIAAIASRLEERLKNLENTEVPVRIVDAEGKIVQEVKVRPYKGDPIILRLSPKTLKNGGTK